MSLLKFQFTLDVARPKRACLDTADFPLTLSVSAIIHFQLLSFCAFCGRDVIVKHTPKQISN